MSSTICCKFSICAFHRLTVSLALSPLGPTTGRTPPAMASLKIGVPPFECVCCSLNCEGQKRGREGEEKEERVGGRDNIEERGIRRERRRKKGRWRDAGTYEKHTSSAHVMPPHRTGLHGSCTALAHRTDRSRTSAAACCISASLASQPLFFFFFGKG